MEALIKREMIGWAIRRNRQAPEIIARKVQVKLEALNAWERGDTRPSFNQALKLANALNVPFGYLYLSTPPSEVLPLPDLRTIKGETPQPSPNFLEVLYDAFRKQEWYRDYLKEEAAQTLTYIGKFNLKIDPVIVAADIRKTLDINQDFRKECDSWDEFLKHFIIRAEKARILVLRSGIVGCNTHRPLNINEFRGFAISDTLAPLIFINENDFKAAEIFTLAHELAHLWLGKSGVSNPDYLLRSKQQHNIIDRYCDRVAAEILVPDDDFILRWGDFLSLNENLDKLSRYYRVSSFVILRRAFENEKINEEVYHSKYEELLTKAKEKKKSSGGDFYRTLLSRNSVTFTKSLILATSEGRILPTEAARLLNLRYTKLNAVESYLFTGNAANA